MVVAALGLAVLAGVVGAIVLTVRLSLTVSKDGDGGQGDPGSAGGARIGGSRRTGGVARPFAGEPITEVIPTPVVTVGTGALVTEVKKGVTAAGAN